MTHRETLLGTGLAIGASRKKGSFSFGRAASWCAIDCHYYWAGWGEKKEDSHVLGLRKMQNTGKLMRNEGAKY